MIFVEMKKGANLMLCYDQQIDALNFVHIILENISALFENFDSKRALYCNIAAKHGREGIRIRSATSKRRLASMEKLMNFRADKARKRLPL